MAVKRLAKVASEFNLGKGTIVDYLNEKGFEVEDNPNYKLSEDAYEALLAKFQPDKLEKAQRADIELAPTIRQEEKSKAEAAPAPTPRDAPKQAPVSGFSKPKLVGKIDLDSLGKTRKPAEPAPQKKAPAPVKEQEEPEAAPLPVAEKEAPIEQAEETPQASESTPKVETETQQPEETPPSIEEEKQEAPLEEKATPEPVAEQEAPAEVEQPEPPVAEEIPQPEEVENPPIEVVAEAKEDEAPVAEAPAEEEAPQEQTDEALPEQKFKKAEEQPKLSGLSVVGKIDLDKFKKKKKPAPVISSDEGDGDKKRRRKRITKDGETPPATDTSRSDSPTRGPSTGGGFSGGRGRPQGRGGGQYSPGGLNQKPQMYRPGAAPRPISRRKPSRSKAKRRQKEEARIQREADAEALRLDNSLKLTEYITAAELANLMDVPVTEVIASFMQLGQMISINQRLDRETIELVVEEFGFEPKFISAEDEEDELEEPDNVAALEMRPPIVTIMGHVDHGKTSLLDHIRRANVVAGEAGGITQHIGAYEVTIDDGRRITFLDTPGHEAFTAMRARGAKVTDVAIIVVAADDAVMPQTKEAIAHAQAAAVPLVFAINKIDKTGANPERVKEELAGMDILVEDWGGKFQSQEISAKKGLNINDLLDKVLLEAEILDLKADPTKRAVGTVIESSMEKGRGIVTTLLVEKGTLRVGDPLVAGQYYARIRAMFNERGLKVDKAEPATPVQVLGFDGSPASGERFYVLENESHAKDLANKRQQLQREQGMRARKRMTLERLIENRDVEQLNLIIKADVDGSSEALADSLQRLSTAEVVVNVIHKGVGQVSDSDIHLAAASDAIIISFNVRPSVSAKRLAEEEEIELRQYSIIYDAIDDVRDAMEGLLKPREEERFKSNIEVREIYKIPKIGTIAGCYVLEGKVGREDKVRIIRDGIVHYTGVLSSLRRFKDDVKDVAAGYECGLSIKNYNDLMIGDIIETFELVQVARKLGDSTSSKEKQPKE